MFFKNIIVVKYSNQGTPSPCGGINVEVPGSDSGIRPRLGNKLPRIFVSFLET